MGEIGWDCRRKGKLRGREEMLVEAEGGEKGMVREEQIYRQMLRLGWLD